MWNARLRAAGGVEVVGGVAADLAGRQVEAQAAVAVEPGDDRLPAEAEFAAADERGRLGEQVFAVGFVAGHAVSFDGGRGDPGSVSPRSFQSALEFPPPE